ncbi:MAG: hypothetical protein BGP25_05060 [Lysobacterales bacterium 63-13]|nr:MAG: hypothetical protein BGP25_05060 [Xanthomonadales bacterium 63-13]
MQTNDLFAARSISPTKLLVTITHLVMGTEREQSEALDAMLDMVDSDINIARRFVRILDANDEIKQRHPEFYRRALQGSGRN